MPIPHHTSAELAGYRVVAVHAHPDDEVLFSGGMLFDLARRGAHVTLLTATLGEEGEIIGEPYQGLCEAGLLGGLRLKELEASAAELGINHEMLGGAGFFHDSGMADMDSHQDPRALVNRVDEAADVLRERLEELDPHIILTYGPDGGYGHPDHIAVHQATHAAAGTERRVWWTVFERESFGSAAATITAPRGWTHMPAAYLENWTNAGADVTYPLDDAALAAKRAALIAHATQVWMADGTVTVTNPEAAYAGIRDPERAPLAFALSNLHVMPLTRAEHLQLGQAGQAVVSGVGPAALFSGLERA